MKNTLMPMKLLMVVMLNFAFAVHAQSSASANAAGSSASAAKPSLTVTSTQVGQSQMSSKLIANGSIAAWQEAIIGSESNGLRIAEVLVNVGDSVNRGQVLARFASEAVNADVTQAKAGLVEAEATAVEATANADRARGLQASGAISKQQIGQYLTAEQTAKARVAAAKASLDVQLLRLKYTQVLAPDSGVISARTATVGAVVGNGAELFRMIRQGRLEWRAEVTSAELSKLSQGMQALVIAPNGEQAQGKVRSLAPTVDVNNRTGLVYVDLTLPKDKKQAHSFKAGMFARGEFVFGNSQALTVPQQAVVVRDGFSYVFKLNNDQRVTQVKVQTGRRMQVNGSEVVEILSGINAGTSIAASGVGFLNDGDLVKLAGAPSNPTTSTKK
ncbi:efflux RND transporter periplasmic adaptor subunit [Undibacterium sp. BYS107W]|uniref:Efflux RND transporter periplasmic adaptor subunit n=1 Tax=Undibacterium baiyunense TaxID=2828731 RepID=A0A941DCF4_9BURK|nr:efflux RND transporter periplasmic adaptor subunit [Undibacterium baiyunense]MBR7745541.1 efflux RND transporter periplasmic adaptor subunit [Undibacterium baiyunense]